MQRCSGAVDYCSETCQKKHWITGRNRECKKQPAAIAEETPSCCDKSTKESEAGATSTKDADTAEEIPRNVRWLGDCPLCYEPVTMTTAGQGSCCGQFICDPCHKKHVASSPGATNCPLCRHPYPKSNKEEVTAVRRALGSERSWAQHKMGDWCRTGKMVAHGVPQSDHKAVKWIRKSAAQGYALAQNRLGLMFDKEGFSTAELKKTADVGERP